MSSVTRRLDQIAAPEPPAAARDDPRRNQDGQAMGTKGRKTRRRLLDATVGLLEIQPLHDIRVADIARQAKTSSATFYLYFQDVADAALAAINEHSQSAPELLQMIAESWHGDDFQQAQRFVETYTAVWNSNAAIFRARNLAAEAGHPGFYAARQLAVQPLLDALTARVRRNQEAGGVPPSVDAFAMAGVLLALLERLSALPILPAPDHRPTHDQLLAAAAYLVGTILQGRQTL